MEQKTFERSPLEQGDIAEILVKFLRERGIAIIGQCCSPYSCGISLENGIEISIVNTIPPSEEEKQTIPNGGE